MSAGERDKVVFDCTVFAQALISPRGPAGACITFAQDGTLALFVSPYVLQEIRELPGKIRPKFGVTAEKVERLISDLAKYAQLIDHVPDVYDNPLDADDSHYINLALTTGSKFVVSRDPHFLKLVDRTEPTGHDFTARFPTLEIITPDVMAQRLRMKSSGGDK